MAGQRDIYQFAVSASAAATSLTARQAEVLRLAGRGLSGKQIARHLGGVPPDPLRDGMRDDQLVSIPSAFDNSVRIGYARVSTRGQDHQAQLDALAAAHCREIVVETASTREARPRLHATLAALHAGDTLVIYKPDRVARSMKELLVLLEDQLHARGVNLHILTGICAGMHARRHPPPRTSEPPSTTAKPPWTSCSASSLTSLLRPGPPLARSPSRRSRRSCPSSISGRGRFPGRPSREVHTCRESANLCDAVWSPAAPAGKISGFRATA